MFGSRGSTVIAAGILALANLIVADTVFIPSSPASGQSVGQYIADGHGFDAPKVSPINNTAYDWWYFDVVSDTVDAVTGGMQSIVVVFFTSTAGGFSPLLIPSTFGFTSVDLVQITVGYANGTLFNTFLNGTGAFITTCGDKTTGKFFDEQGSIDFMGSYDLSSYTIEFNTPAIGLVGTVNFGSVAPPHYFGGPAFKGQNMEIDQEIGWANAVPDAVSRVDLKVGGQDFNFTGTGYHDKNWGLAPFWQTVRAWYWGHGRLGPYSVVWFDYISPSGVNRLSSYVARDNEILVASTTGIQARPIGENSTYPPLSTTGGPTGFHISVDVPEGTLAFDVIGRGIIGGISPGNYTRWAGWMTGGLNNATDLQGPSIFEQFAFTTPVSNTTVRRY